MLCSEEVNQRSLVTHDADNLKKMDTLIYTTVKGQSIFIFIL